MWKLVEGEMSSALIWLGLADSWMCPSTLDNVAQMKQHTESFRGVVADSAESMQDSPELKQLMDVTKECLYRGIAAAKVGNVLVTLAQLFEYAESHGYGVVRDLVGEVQPCMRSLWCRALRMSRTRLALA